MSGGHCEERSDEAISLFIPYGVIYPCRHCEGAILVLCDRGNRLCYFEEVRVPSSILHPKHLRIFFDFGGSIERGLFTPSKTEIASSAKGMPPRNDKTK